ncbi:MAG: DUF1638 domain-containing protein, partial [Candidatus Latescibacteria bacterium]|nr:DUF1638 domain-containing protein [Candidatus Latescibacterota bacterium]
IRHIQKCIDAVEEDRFDGILIGYGLCNTMLDGLWTRHTPLIVPRAHDCITLFLGSTERYSKYFLDHPGSYYYTAGWLEHRQRDGERPERRQGAGLGEQRTFEEMVAQYGEDNARYLLEAMGNWTRHYSRGVFIDFDFSTHLPCKEQARALCAERDWSYEEVAGDLSLLQGFLDGPWPEEDFLTVSPGARIAPSYDERIIQIDGLE